MDNNYLTKREGEDSLNLARQFLQSFQNLMVNYDDMAARLEQCQLRIRELEQDNERLLTEQQKNGSWASRVTYENVVELIASYEDASQRDEARKLIEPLLKKDQVRQLRRDIKKKMKELESAEEPAEEVAEVPEILTESELWKKVQEAGLVDEDGQPTVSRTEAALLADELAERLDISHKWKLFETLWHRNNMRGDYNTALEQKKSLLFQEKLKKLLG
jgi:hypothetical protein